MGEGEPLWARALFSLVPLLMGLVILGAWAGVVPTEGGSFHAPAVVIIALGAGLILFSVMMWIPSTTPAALRSALFAILLLLVAVVCNWTAFAPGIRYTSEVTIGGWTSSGEDPLGGRIAFGLLAIAIDAGLAYGVYLGIRRWLRRA
jgi:hypothetical protein